MTTESERKQVAQRLRRIEERGATVEEYRWYLQLVKNRALLASLIEPEPEKTCEDVSTEYGEFECSYCGCKITNTECFENGGVYFCPDCGRTVENAY